VAALSVTGDRERFLDFSHPYYISGLSPAFSSRPTSAWYQTLRAFVSWEFVSAVGSLALVLLAAGTGLWLFERKRNSEEFGGGNVARGLGDGLWWSAVTMTTVGYGDKAPKTLGGRIVALVWMFLSLIIIAGFTASIAASLTANRLAVDASREGPISDMKVGVLEGSAAEEYARSQGSLVVPFPALAEAVEAVRAARVDTVIHDAPILEYEIRRSEAALPRIAGELDRVSPIASAVGQQWRPSFDCRGPLHGRPGVTRGRERLPAPRVRGDLRVTPRTDGPPHSITSFDSSGTAFRRL